MLKRSIVHTVKSGLKRGRNRTLRELNEKKTADMERECAGENAAGKVTRGKIMPRTHFRQKTEKTGGGGGGGGGRKWFNSQKKTLKNGGHQDEED